MNADFQQKKSRVQEIYNGWLQIKYFLKKIKYNYT